jgi:tRNA A37 threonylcarbamoyladenosine biosynthesis protein TsaE
LKSLGRHWEESVRKRGRKMLEEEMGVGKTELKEGIGELLEMRN